MSDDGILKPKNVLGAKRVEAPAPEQQTVSTSNVTASKLNELDLDTELLDQYKNAKLVLTDILHADDIAANQKAQVMNTVTSILQAIIKLQQELHNVERLKLIEATLIETLQGHDTLRDAFLKDYEKALGKLK